MRIWRSLDDVPADLGRTVVVIGNFDGVHRGHQAVIARARQVADGHDHEHLVAVTFEPHPMRVLLPERAPVMLSDVATRCDLLAQAGCDDVLVLPFTRDLAALSPEEFVQRVLVDALHADAVVVGANFRYGARAAGDVETLSEAGGRHGFGVVGVALAGDQEDPVWSSTHVRESLAAGDVVTAAHALGRAHVVRGVVRRGDRRGRELGYPTANVPPGELAAPADGVYAGWLTRLDTGERFPAAISVGTNPTFEGERERRVEAYVLDRDDLELYDVAVEIAFVERIRGMVAFDGIDPLLEAMADDVRRTREVLSRPPSPAPR